MLDICQLMCCQVKRVSLTCICLLISFFFLLPNAQTFAQTEGREAKRLDSLYRIAKSLPARDQVDQLNRIAFDWFGSSNKKALEVATESYTLANQVAYDKGKSEALVYMGLFERLAGNNEKSFQYLNQGVTLASKVKQAGVAGYGLVQLANLYTAIGKNDSALQSYQKSYQFLKDSLYPSQLSTLYKNWGLFYMRKFEKEKAWSLLFRSLKIREQAGDSLFLSDIYMTIAEQYVAESKYNDAFEYIKKAEPILDTFGHELETTYDYKYLKAVILMRQSNYGESLKLFNELKNHYKEYTSKQGYVNLLSNIGYTLQDVGNYELSLNNYFDALKIANQNNFELEKAKLFWQIGLVYNSLKQYNLAKEFANKCLTVSSKNNYKVEYATALNLLGLIYDSNKKYDSALNFYQRALVLREEIRDPARVASTLNNIGTVLEEQKKYSQALSYQLRSLSLERQNSNPWGTAATLQALGRLYLRLQDFDVSKKYLDESESIARKIDARYTLLEVYQVMIEWYEAQGKLSEVVQYYKKLNELKDSVYSSSLSNRIASLQNEFTILQKNQEIELLNRDKKLREQELGAEQSRVRQQRIIIFSGLLFLLVVVGASYVIYTNYKKVSALNRKVQENNEEIQAQSEELQVSNQMIVQINEGLEEMVESRTKELKQAYKELDTFFYRSSHDFRRPLTTFMGLAEVAKITVRDEQALGLFEKVNETARSLDKMLVKLQSISDVGSTQLIFKEIFFNEIINNTSDLFRDELKAKDIRLNAEVAVTSFSSYPALLKVVIENLIENSIYFSKPHQTVKIRAYSVEGGVTVEVEDTGYGIDEEYIDRVFDMYFRAHEQSRGNGLGLYIVKRVIEKMHGTITLTSKVNVGTRVSVFLPHQTSQIGSI